MHQLACSFMSMPIPCWCMIFFRSLNGFLSLAGVGEGYTMWDLYCDYWRPFGELLTEMERKGMMVDRWGLPCLLMPVPVSAAAGPGALHLHASDLRIIYC